MTAQGGGFLSGIRVVEFTWVAAAPGAGMLLALQGADVIRVESPTRADYARFVENPTRDPDLAPVYQALNLGKRVVTVDLKDSTGGELARRLVLSADVVIESMRPGVLKALGIDYDELRLVRPALVMASLSGFGQSGPEARYASYAPIFGAAGGLSYQTGYPDSIPTQIRASADMRSGVALLVPLLAALHRAKRDGIGSYIDVAAVETSASLLGDLLMDLQMNGRNHQRVGNSDQRMSPHGVFETIDAGVFLSIACRDDQDWAGIVRVLPEMEDPVFAHADSRLANGEELHRRLRDLVRTMKRGDLKDALQREGVPAVESMSNQNVFEDQHAHERGIWVSVDHPRQGQRWAIGVPWMSSLAGRGVTPRRAPLYGEHSREVLKDELAVGDAEWDDLVGRGVVCERSPDAQAT